MFTRIALKLSAKFFLGMKILNICQGSNGKLQLDPQFCCQQRSPTTLVRSKQQKRKTPRSTSKFYKNTPITLNFTRSIRNRQSVISFAPLITAWFQLTPSSLSFSLNISFQSPPGPFFFTAPRRSWRHPSSKRKRRWKIERGKKKTIKFHFSHSRFVSDTPH